MKLVSNEELAAEFEVSVLMLRIVEKDHFGRCGICRASFVLRQTQNFLTTVQNHRIPGIRLYVWSADFVFHRSTAAKRGRDFRGDAFCDVVIVVLYLLT